MIHQKFFGSQAEKVTPENLGEAIQQAIEIEISTIPTYLFTYYSINRAPNQQSMINLLTNALLKIDKEPRYTFDEATEIALDISADIMVFANKTGALIMSVAIEEMLHMALSSNLKQALAGRPDLYGRSPATWPADLPGHKPALKINAAKLSMDQLETFLNIEKPMKPKQKLLKSARNFIPYPTIGEFYDMVIDCLDKNPDLRYNTRSPQLVPGKGYYAQNNIDTIYYDKEHKPVFTNHDDSGDLICVADKKSAIAAINLIVEQGEGKLVKDAPYLDKDNNLDFAALLQYDFKSDGEEPSHFEKFAEIYQTFYQLKKKYDAFDIEEMSFEDLFVMNVRSNPATTDYPANIAPVSDLINGVYTYIFVMIEECYRKSGSTQYETFMFGIHKSMIFILNSLCGDIMKLQYTAADGKQYYATPTFENYNFSPVARPKAQLQNLYAAAVAVYPGISYLGVRIDDLPDVDLK
ncbi:ferritin-like domain-containing protein [Flavobacterium sp. 3HN19-14]|uniref:ferritin-like domain-containing protein n=1 Tax=Flavobacterium sp. 3HN19-14 TaxID=3448133 RepID=UPI003EE40A06